MKNTLNVVRNQLKAIIALGVLAILIIETIRAITDFPTPVVPHEGQDGIKSPMQAWGNMVGQFAYFTIWTNILFVLTLVLSWVFRIKINPYWKNAIATYLMVMLIVFFTLIIPYMNWKSNWWIIFILMWEHLGVVIIGLWWFFTTKTETKTKLGSSMLLTATIPAIYLGFALTLYFVFQIAPYNFLNFKNSLNLNLPFYASVIVSISIIIVIGLITILFSWLFTNIDNWKAISVRRGKKGGKKSPKRRRVLLSKQMQNPPIQTQDIQQMQQPEIIMEEITIEIPIDNKKINPIKKKVVLMKKKIMEKLSKDKKPSDQKKSSAKNAKKSKK